MFGGLVRDLNQLVKIAGNKKKAFVYAKTDEEKNYIKESSGYLRSTLGFEKLVVYGPNDENVYDPSQKAMKSKAGKPGIYLE